MEAKVCSKCHEAKPLERFSSNPTCRGGLSTRCKDCDNAYLREYYRRNVKKRMLIGAKDRAIKASLPFNLTEGDIEIPDCCPALGIPLASGSTKGGTDASPSLDRVKPELGYVRGNVQVISGKANRIKSNASASELEAVARWLKNLVDE